MNELLLELYSRQSWLEAQMTENARQYRALGKEPPPDELTKVTGDYEVIKEQLNKITLEIEATHASTTNGTGLNSPEPDMDENVTGAGGR